MVEGLAIACVSRAPLANASDTDAQAGWARQCESIFLQLLSHRSPAVMLAVYSLLEGLVQEAADSGNEGVGEEGMGDQHPLMQLLVRQVSVFLVLVLSAEQNICM